MALPVLWDPRPCADEVRRVAAKGCHSLTFTENPATLGYPSFHDEHWDPLWRAVCDENVVVSIHLGSSGQLAVTAPNAPIDVMITLQPMNICQAAADLLWSRVIKKFPDDQVRAVRGRHRLDPVLPRPGRPHLRHAPPVDRPGLRRQAAERGLPRALPDVLHLRPGRDQAARADRPGQHRLGVRLPALGLLLAARPRGARGRWPRTSRPRTWTRSPTRTPCAGTPSTRSRPGPKERCTVGALRAEVAGHDVSIQSRDKGRFTKSVGVDIGKLTGSATA